MKFICECCGAEIDDSMPKCPYCDQMIAKGAEEEYMDRLYDIQEDMEELKEMPMEAVKQEVKSQGKKIRKILIFTALIAAVIAVIFIWHEKKYERDHTEDLIWEQENFPIMSEMYENQKYEELEAFYMDALEEDRPVWEWEYFDEYNEWMEEK